jgi:outer membrane protein assembly factor BamB
MKPVLVALLFGGATFAQNWPQFRGPQGSGVAEKADIPVQFDVAKGTNVRWKTAIPGVAVSSPIVWRDHVFVTTAVSSDTSASIRTGLYGDVEPSKDTSKHSWEVYALDRRSGKVLWKRVAHEGVPKTKRHPKSSQASSTPVTDGNVVIAHFGSEGLYAYDFKGNLLWKQDLGPLNAGWFFDPTTSGARPVRRSFFATW